MPDYFQNQLKLRKQKLSIQLIIKKTPGILMSFHKLKIGSRRKDQPNSLSSSHQKVGIKNQQVLGSLNLQNKLNSRKANIISMSDDFNSQILKIKKSQFIVAPKTDRVHKIERIDFHPTNVYSKKIPSNKYYYKNSNSNCEQNRQYSASELINFLDTQPNQNRYAQQLYSRVAVNSKLQKSQITHQTKQKYNIKNPTTQSIDSNLGTYQKTPIIVKTIKLEQCASNQQKTQTISVQTENDREQQKVTGQINRQLLQVEGETVTQDNMIEKATINQSQNQILKINQHQDITTRNQSSLVRKKQMIAIIQQKQKNKGSASVQKRRSLSVLQQSDSLIESQKAIESKTQKEIQSPFGQKQCTGTQQHVSSPTKSKLSYKPINQVELTIIQQNKTLSQQVQKLRRQRDQLLFTNKRYEVQLLQLSCKQYYQKQISRLKLQVQTLQCSQQQLRHNNFTFRNRNKQLQSSEQVHKKQFKKLLKDFEGIKVQSTKQKFQLKEKGASLQMIIKKLQQGNGDLSNKFQEYYNKFQQLQRSHKLKCEEQLNLRKVCQSLESKFANSQKANSQKIRHYQQETQRFYISNSQLSTENREFRRQSEAQIDSLRQSIKQTSLKRQSETLLISSRIKGLQKHNSMIEAELKVVRLEQTVKELQLEIQKRSHLIRQLNAKIDLMIGMADYQELRKQLEQLSQSKQSVTRQYQKEILSLNLELQQLTRKFEESQKQLAQKDKALSRTNAVQSGPSSSKADTYHKQNFKEILKQQISQTDSLKQDLFNKSQQLFQSKQHYEQIKIKYDYLKNDQQILKKKFTSFENNAKIKKQISQQQSNNEIESIKRKLSVMQRKLQSKVKENSQKDKFIQGCIIGKTNSQNDAQYLLKELQRILLQRQKIENC